MQIYQQNYFSWIFVFKDAKSYLVFLFIYANIIFLETWSYAYK